MIILNEREKKIAVFCLLMMFIYLNMTFVLQPIRDQEARIDADISKSYKLLNRHLRILKNDDAAEREYSKYISQIVQKDSDEKEFSTILSEVESSANDIGVRIVNIKPGKVKAEDFYNRFYINLSVDGQLKDIMHFLYILQQEPRYFKAENVRLEKDSVSKITGHVLLSRILIPRKFTVIEKY